MIRDGYSAAARVELLLREFAGDPAMAERAEELVRTLVEFYGDGLGRLVELIGDQPGGAELLAGLAEDRVVSGLLVLHDLHPATTEERVAAALERVRPYLGSHSGDVELIAVEDDGVVRLRLDGSCHGCPSSALTVKLAIERAIEDVAPEVTRVEVDGMVTDDGGPGGRTLLPILSTPVAVVS